MLVPFYASDARAPPPVSSQMMLQAAKLIGAGLCTIAFDGVGGGIGTIVSALIISVARNPHLMKQLFAYAILRSRSPRQSRSSLS